MNFNKENIARFGLGAMGFVYIVVGFLTAMAAFNWGGQKTGTKGAIGFINNQYLGKLLLIVIALGLFSYVFWRLYQTLFDSRRLGTDLNGLFVRAGYFSGALFYGSLGVIAIKLFFGGGYDENQEFIIKLLNSEYGSAVSVILGLILGGKCVFEIFFIFSNQFKKNVKSSEMPPKAKSILLKFGVIGHLARAVVFGIMAFLTIRTGVTFRNEELSTVADAFQFLNYQFGALVLSLVAFGLICYGLYMFVKARYLYINM
ncbi:DUF1206 domain-containing protein [Gelidibacter salicanalis]|uniref:DUF1206 domain-containing protein n=1 Tax=Gelidibacter salicanalis TaxID=291193 RepID=A0A934KQ23_9FLAO|nr:DUF1206 domain-containing protein [Gelidibacter salicanalis]MBJ7879371.1 DUF1206 domain-containing protein [Gelidibacter salicanalis]